ncbi:hypothetical protein I4U23_029325 [Adineta vaga]|nr:hypothetical protein I4U23_029325 [Adineta vaga]
MQIPHKSVILGVVLGVIPIALGVVALATPQWFKTTSSTAPTFGLFNINNTYMHTDTKGCYNTPKEQTVKGLEIGGVGAIFVGVILSFLLHMLIKNRWIRFIPQILLILGPSAILIGLILLLECAKWPGLGYSFIIMSVACITGYILAIYFALVTALGAGHHHHSRTSSTVIVRESVRF